MTQLSVRRRTRVMRQIVLKAAKFLVALVGCTVLCTIFWETVVAGGIYHCSDPGFLQFLKPGDWIHGDVVGKDAHYGDTLRRGWSMTSLWILWYSLVAASIGLSAWIAMPGRHHSIVECANAAEQSGSS